jgi:hypothetical protein
MGKNNEMTANSAGSDDEDNSEDAGGMADDSEDSGVLDHEAKEEDANMAGLSAQLRGLYKDLLDEPIPDRFAQLLKELENKEADKQ